MNSLMSIRIIESSLPNKNFARHLASSVFPTPVGPINKKLPIGLRGSLKPVLARLIALDTALTASSWPINLFEISASIFNNLSVSASVNCFTGTPVCSATTEAISSAVISTRSIFLFVFQLFNSVSNSSLNLRSLSRNSVARSYFSECTAFSFCLRTSSICFSIFLIYSGGSRDFKRVLAPASSIKSIPLSGKNLSLIYLDDN